VWTYLAAGVGFAFAAAVQPGPFQAFVIAETLRRGARRAWPAAFAPLVSDAPILLVCLTMLSRVPPSLVRVLHLAAAVYLAYLAWGAYRTWRRSRETAFDPAASAGSSSGTLFKAAAVNFLNPNPWLGWSLVMGPLLLDGWAAAPPHGVALVAGFYVTMVACQLGLILLVSSARRFGSAVVSGGQAAAAVALGAFALYQLWLGLRAVG